MKKMITLLALSASVMAVPAFAMPADLAKSADMTRAQAQSHAEAYFDKMDVNKDGKWDAADRTARQNARHEARFMTLDANKDGSVSKAEFDQARAQREAKMAERRTAFAAQRAERMARAAAPASADAAKTPRGEHRFGRRDGRGGGRYHGIGGGHGGRGAFAGLGMGPNASITKADFITQSLTRFDQMDANKDGIVTVAERQTARAAMRAQRGERGERGGRGERRPAPTAPAAPSAK